MPIVKLDASFCLVAQSKAGKKRTDYYDTAITGFVLECRASGGKTFLLRYQNEYGKQCRRKIGMLGDITFAQARKIAERLRSQVVTGGDPAADKARKKSVPTYDTLADQHYADVKTYSKNPDNIERILRCHIRPKWGNTRVDEIRTQDVAIWQVELRQKGLAPATVEKIRVTFNRSFELALKWQTPGVVANPVRAVTRMKYNNKRTRYLTSDETAQLLTAAAASKNKQLKHIIGLLLLTGARKAELLKAKWRDVDVVRKVWYIPDTKTSVPRHVPLSQPAIDILNRLPKWDKCQWLIPNPETKAPYTCIKHPFDTVRKKAKLDDLHIHDLRHSAASFMINAGIDLFAVGRVLGHADHKSTMRYAHLSNDTLIKAVEAGALKMNVDWTTGKAA